MVTIDNVLLRNSLKLSLGERTPVRRRLENLFPPVWNLCEANKAMFASIAQFDKQKVQSLGPIHVERLVENNGAEKPGAW